MGNGYVKVPVDEGRTVEGDCEYCKNQGEVEINEETIGDLVSSNGRMICKIKNGLLVVII